MVTEERLIDANALRTDFLKKHRITDTEFDICSPWWKFSQAIANAPTVDAVEVVHGEWLDGYGVCDNNKSYISIDCSNCGEYFKLPSIDENIEEWKKRFAYCPFCGAKMDGDGNG